MSAAVTNNNNNNNNHEEMLSNKIEELTIQNDVAKPNSNSNSLRKRSMGDVPRDEDRNESVINERSKELADSYLDILYTIGENPQRPGLKKTPERAAKALLHFTKGYEEKIAGKC